MTDEEAHAEIVARLRARLTALAAARHARLREEPPFDGYDGTDVALVLHPRSTDATPIRVWSFDAHTTFVEFGNDVMDEIITSPESVQQAVDDVMEVIDAVADGRAKQRLWFTQHEPEPIGAQAWVQLTAGERWVPFQSWGRIPWPFFGSRYRYEDIHYAAYS